MKVLVINCGSSSLKYQLIDMDGEKVLCKGESKFRCARVHCGSGCGRHAASTLHSYPCI